MTTNAKYQPSNGTEGMDFIDYWCGNCARDLEQNGTKHPDDCDEDDWCPIIAKTMLYSSDAPEYPSEWTYDSKGCPCCTAFIPKSDPPKSDPIPPPRDDMTVDMFSEGWEGY